jgi:hypothetical protein
MIHTVTAYAATGPSRSHALGDSRCFGYWPTRAEARAAIVGDQDGWTFHEAYYTHLVIEAIAPGCHGEATEEEWFEWENDAWHLCARPGWAEGVCNHSMG